MAKKTVNKKQSKPKSNNKKFEDQVKGLKIGLKEQEDKYLRLFAEFENYKKRTTKERIELYKTAGPEVISSLLPVLDDFTRAIKKHLKSVHLQKKTIQKGLKMVNRPTANQQKAIRN